MDTSNTRVIQEKPASTTKTTTSSRRSASPTNETKGNNKKLRPSGNTDVREWDLPKFQQETEKSSTERHVVEESTGIEINHDARLSRPALVFLSRRRSLLDLFSLPLSEK